MRFNISALLILAHSLLLRGHSGPNKPDGKVIGGHNTTPSNHPYLVSLQTRFFMIRSHICGGTLLNENWILSAAHCVKGSLLVKWLPLDAVAGASNAHDVQSHNFGPGAQIATVDQRISHPSYSGGIQPNDIAVLHTSTPFRFTKDVMPAILPIPSEASYEHNLKLAGWGVLKTTFFFPDLPRYLQEVNVTYLPYKDCYEAVEAIKDAGEVNPLDEDSNICTGPITGGVSACSGDSGGPLIKLSPKLLSILNTTTNDENVIEDEYPLPEPQNRDSQTETGDGEMNPTVIGVVSWGASPCGDKGAPTVYTKVENYIDFINKYVQYLNSFYSIKLV